MKIIHAANDYQNQYIKKRHLKPVDETIDLDFKPISQSTLNRFLSPDASPAKSLHGNSHLHDRKISLKNPQERAESAELGNYIHSLKLNSLESSGTAPAGKRIDNRKPRCITVK